MASYPEFTNGKLTQLYYETDSEFILQRAECRKYKIDKIIYKISANLIVHITSYPYCLKIKYTSTQFNTKLTLYSKSHFVSLPTLKM